MYKLIGAFVFLYILSYKKHFNGLFDNSKSLGMYFYKASKSLMYKLSK